MNDAFRKAYQAGIGGLKGEIRYIDQAEQKRQRDIEGQERLNELYSKPMAKIKSGEVHQGSIEVKDEGK